MGLKIAVSGKGGVGKTTVAATLGEFFSSLGYKTVLIDADPDSNLAAALGVEKEKRAVLKPLSMEKELVKERVGTEPGMGGMFILNPKVDDLVEKYGLQINKNLVLVVTVSIEKAGSGCFFFHISLLRALLSHLVLERDEWVIVDMEAGLEHLGRSTAENIDYLLVVVEPGQRSLETAKKIKTLAEELGIKKILVVVNKLKDEATTQKIEEFLKQEGLPILAALPWEQRLALLDLEDQPVRSLGQKNPFFLAVARAGKELVKNF